MAARTDGARERCSAAAFFVGDGAVPFAIDLETFAGEVSVLRESEETTNDHRGRPATCRGLSFSAGNQRRPNVPRVRNPSRQSIKRWRNENEGPSHLAQFPLPLADKSINSFGRLTRCCT